MNQIRYYLDCSNIRKLARAYKSKETFEVKYYQTQIVWVDILEVRDEDWAYLRLYYPDGEVVTGWTWQLTTYNPIKIHNYHLLFDGRFNVGGSQ